jgi:dTDP-glucose pyrophosphorylase
MPASKYNNWLGVLLPSTASIKEVIEVLDRSGIRLVIISSAIGCFEGTITDGDVRRGLLKGLSLTDTCFDIVNRAAIVVKPGVGLDSILQLMIANKIQQIPVIDDANRVVGLYLRDDLEGSPKRCNKVVIMAGGVGSRLLPFTEKCPKPLLPVAGKPMLLHIIEQAKSNGFNKFVISINHLGEMIENYFGSGEKFGVEIEYIRENTPLGTAGALSIFDFQEDMPIIVTNGDVISDINFSELLDFHNAHNGIATMAVKSHEWQHPFGVVQIDELEVIGIQEKPITKSYINAGVYVLDLEILKLLSKNQQCDMPTLIMTAKQKKQAKIFAYPMHEPWLDVGRPDDLKMAKDVKETKNGETFE